MAKRLYDQGKLKGLNAHHINLLENNLSSVVKLLDAAAVIQLKFKGLSL
jgi:hypothetical protein